MRRAVPLVLMCLAAAPAAGQACFDPAQCAREALTMTRALSREMAIMDGEIRALRADRAALAAELAALRERIAVQAARMERFEADNDELRRSLGVEKLPPSETR
ncbi:MAG: hypothetical protein ACU0DK_04980 [Pseudooceanicola sp.]